MSNSITDELVSFLEKSPEMKIFRKTVKTENKTLLTSANQLLVTAVETPRVVWWALAGKSVYSKKNLDSFIRLMTAVKELADLNNYDEIFYVAVEVSYRKQFGGSGFDYSNFGMPFLGVSKSNNPNKDLDIVDVGFVGRRPYVRVYDQNTLRKVIERRVSTIKDVSFGHAQIQFRPINAMVQTDFKDSLKGYSSSGNYAELLPPVHF